MEIDDFKAFIEKLNGYCGCEELQGLYSQRRKAETLGSRCAQMNREVDLANPSKEDEKFLLEFKKVAEKFSEEIMKYHLILTESAKTGKIKTFLRYSREFGKDKYLTPREASNILQADEESILSLHCARCNQQIDLIARVLFP